MTHRHMWAPPPVTTGGAGATSTRRTITAKFNSRCAGCGNPVYEGDRVQFDVQKRLVFCSTCFDASPNAAFAYTSKRFLWALVASLEQPVRIPAATVESYGSDCALLMKTDAATGDHVLSTFPESAHKIRRETRVNGVPLVALAALEEALLARAETDGLTERLTKRWEQFRKIKARALSPTGTKEDSSALRTMVKGLVDETFL